MSALQILQPVFLLLGSFTGKPGDEMSDLLQSMTEDPAPKILMALETPEHQSTSVAETNECAPADAILHYVIQAGSSPASFTAVRIGPAEGIRAISVDDGVHQLSGTVTKDKWGFLVPFPYPVWIAPYTNGMIHIHLLLDTRMKEDVSTRGIRVRPSLQTNPLLTKAGNAGLAHLPSGWYSLW